LKPKKDAGVSVPGAEIATGIKVNTGEKSAGFLCLIVIAQIEIGAVRRTVPKTSTLAFAAIPGSAAKTTLIVFAAFRGAGLTGLLLKKSVFDSKL
jgi:hypothetical protein